MCMIDGADPWDFSGDWRNHKARITHKCSECRRDITPGEQYGTFFAKMDGMTFNYKQCAHCEMAAKWLKVICSGWLTEGILEDLEQHWDESPTFRSLWLGRAILGMRSQWRRRNGTLLPVLPALPESVMKLAHA